MDSIEKRVLVLLELVLHVHDWEHLNDQEKLKLFAECMDKCGLSFTTYIVEEKENG